MADAEAAAPVELPPETWIQMTQVTLGQLIAKPRMLPDRLRKPPFRFLFDAAAEVARSTGFGNVELFGGNVTEKPVLPSSKADKVAFLERLIGLTVSTLGPHAGQVACVSAQDVVCGIRPEWTNYLLQGIAAAAFPTVVGMPPPPDTEPAPVQQAAHTTTVQPEPGGQPPEPVPEVPPSEPPVQVLDEEQARRLAQDMDFSTCLKDLDQVHQDFMRTTDAFNQAVTEAPPPEGSAAEGGTAECAPRQDGVNALKAAAMKTTKVTESIMQAEDLMATIEAGLDDVHANIQERRHQEEMKRAALEEERQRAEADAAARAAAEAHAAALEEQAERLEEQRRDEAANEEKARRRAAKEAEKAAKRAEKEAEEKRLAMYPVSKHSATHGARIVSCVGGDEDEYAWDGEDEEGGNNDAAATAASGIAPGPAPAPAPEAPSAALDMGGLGACLTDDLLGPADPVQAANDPLAFLTANPAVAATRLFDKLKADLKDTYLSYLCASMPESLLRQYDNDELIQCLQMLLTELRKCIATHGLEDILDEEPTSIAEELRASHPGDWPLQLQNGAAWALRQKYDVPELVDTLQILSQTCEERLTNALGPIQAWTEESSPLRYVPPAAPPVAPPPEPMHVGPEPQMTAYAVESNDAPQPWSTSLGAAAATTHGGFQNPATTASRLASASPVRPATHQPVFDGTLGPAAWDRAPTAQARASPSPPPRTGNSRAPNFDATLGPAPWELTGPMPTTAASRMGMGTGAMQQRGATGRPMTMRPATHAVGRYR
mmetsp:Transcript_95088/g.268580  ORF Transcript_95088/g.268580 Transcript_95088/m.268580 type:complete len:774 (-) Transcript_95088:182-2503(-)